MSAARPLASKRAPADQKLAIELVNDFYMPNLLPLAWAAGLYQVLIWPLFCDSVPIILPAFMPQPMTSAYAHEVAKLVPKGKKNGIMFVPDVLREMVKSGTNIDILIKYDWIGYAGAPLDSSTGDLISKYTRVQAFMGATDTGGLYPFLLNEPSDWKIHRFHPDMSGYHSGTLP